MELKLKLSIYLKKSKILIIMKMLFIFLVSAISVYSKYVCLKHRKRPDTGMKILKQKLSELNHKIKSEILRHIKL